MDNRMLLGAIRLVWHFAFAKNRKILKEVVKELSNVENATKNKILIMSVGLSNSGKSTTLPLLTKEYFPENIFFKIISNNIHDKINGRFKFLQGKDVVGNSVFWERQFLTMLIRKKIMKTITEYGYDILNDSCNAKRRQRKEYMAFAKKKGYTTIIAWMNKEDADILALMRSKAKEIGTPEALKLYKDLFGLQKKRYDAPFSYEADRTFAYVATDKGLEWREIYNRIES